MEWLKDLETSDVSMALLSIAYELPARYWTKEKKHIYNIAIAKFKIKQTQRLFKQFEYSTALQNKLVANYRVGETHFELPVDSPETGPEIQQNMSAIIKAYAENRISENQFTVLTRAINTYISLHTVTKTEALYDELVKKVDKLENPDLADEDEDDDDEDEL